MPFLRFSRDKRGYENFYLIQPSSGRRGKSRPRILYWFRTPPNVKVGRRLFDDDVQRAIEAQYPHISFEWKKLLDTPIPPPAEVEPWRERRRVERAAKAAAASELAAMFVAAEDEPSEPDDQDPRDEIAALSATGDAGLSVAERPPEVLESPEVLQSVEVERPFVSGDSDAEAMPAEDAETSQTPSSPASSPTAGPASIVLDPSRKRRRRRRGGRRNRQRGGGQVPRSADEGSTQAPASGAAFTPAEEPEQET